MVWRSLKIPAFAEITFVDFVCVDLLGLIRKILAIERLDDGGPGWFHNVDGCLVVGLERLDLESERLEHCGDDSDEDCQGTRMREHRGSRGARGLKFRSSSMQCKRRAGSLRATSFVSIFTLLLTLEHDLLQKVEFVEVRKESSGKINDAIFKSAGFATKKKKNVKDCFPISHKIHILADKILAQPNPSRFGGWQPSGYLLCNKFISSKLSRKNQTKRYFLL